jgi:predicted metal-dependent hydrolase
VDQNLFETGVNYFNDGEFFLAHDIFEEIWVEALSEEKLFFQGLVHVSVGYFHYVCGNFKGSFNMLSKALKKIEVFTPACKGINLDSLVSQMKITIFEVDKIMNHNKRHITYEHLPKLIILKPLEEN